MTYLCPTYIVDDDAHVRASLQLELAALGIDAATFATGKDFVAAIGTLSPGCVLLDVSQPADGIGVLRQIAHRPEFQSVMMSGSHNALDAALAIKLGAVQWLEKPFAEDSLVEAIGDACARISAPEG